MIYAISAVGTEYIKFGRATSIGQRLRELDTGCPHELNVLATAQWQDGAERAIHRLLAGHRAKGEWFSDCDTARQIIEWMWRGEDGLKDLRAAMSSKTGLPSWTEAIKIKRQQPTLTPQQIRRKQREEWWKLNGSRVNEQPSQTPIP